MKTLQPKPGLTNGDIVNLSAVWRVTAGYLSPLAAIYYDDLERPYKRGEVRHLISIAWGILYEAILLREPMTEWFWYLPPDIVNSRVCIEAILTNPPLLDLVQDGKVSRLGIEKLVKDKGIWL